MVAHEGSYGLEWSHVWLWDKCAVEPFPSDVDPTRQLVFSTTSTLTVRGLPEGEGDTRLRVVFDEELNDALPPILLASGRFSAVCGEIIARTSSWDELITLVVPPGLYDFAVYADDADWPSELLLHFTGRQGN